MNFSSKRKKKVGLQKCVPCEGGVKSLSKTDIDRKLKGLSSWSVGEGILKKNFTFKNFIKAMQFVNDVAKIAEEEGHHPDFHIHYNKVLIELWTHAVNGLTQNDFILASRIDELC